LLDHKTRATAAAKAHCPRTCNLSQRTCEHGRARSADSHFTRGAKPASPIIAGVAKLCTLPRRRRSKQTPSGKKNRQVNISRLSLAVRSHGNGAPTELAAAAATSWARCPAAAGRGAPVAIAEQAGRRSVAVGAQLPLASSGSCWYWH